MTNLRVAVLALAVVASGCEVNLNTEGLIVKDTRTFNVSGTPDLTVETFDGRIEVHTWDRAEVEVEIEKRGMDQALIDEMRVAVEQQGDRIVLEVTGPSRQASRGITVGVHISTEARLRVAMPRRATLTARTGDGAIRVEDIEGRLSLLTGDGSVTADRVSGDVEVRTRDGAIRVTAAEGRLDLETEDGSITVGGRPARLRADSGDGAIRVTAESGTAVTDGWDLSTRDGSITLTLPEDFAAEIDAATGDGSIRSSHPALSIDREEGRRIRDLRARMGAGGAVVKVRTGDGSIRVER
jgi:DUF4097 and DUF4098 domain-containing protein YvlB